MAEKIAPPSLDYNGHREMEMHSINNTIAYLTEGQIEKPKTQAQKGPKQAGHAEPCQTRYGSHYHLGHSKFKNTTEMIPFVLSEIESYKSSI